MLAMCGLYALHMTEQVWAMLWDLPGRGTAGRRSSSWVWYVMIVLGRRPCLARIC
jgi:hypothetical protein